MDQPTPDLPSPTPDPEPPTVPEIGPEPVAGPAPSPREHRIGARLGRLVGDEESVVTWTRGWVSREGRFHTMLAARTLDFGVVTDRSLQLYSTGFFTRRPRRRVYSSRFERIFVAHDDGRHGRRRLRISSRSTAPLWFELDASERAAEFARALLARARSQEPRPVEVAAEPRATADPVEPARSDEP
jgi:hypothetical protein